MNPWRKIDEKLTYDGYRKVLRKTFAMPDDTVTDFDTIKGADAVAVLAVTSDHKVVCFRQFRPGPEKILNELPGGGIEADDLKQSDDNSIQEISLIAAARELREETGYTAELEYIGSYYRDAYTNGLWHMVVGQNAVKSSQQQLDPTEFGELKLLALQDFKKELFAGNMTDTTCGYAGLNHLGLL